MPAGAAAERGPARAAAEREELRAAAEREELRAAAEREELRAAAEREELRTAAERAFAAALAGRAVCVTGLGVSGPPVARALLDRGARVTVIDGRTDEATRERAERLRHLGARVLLGAEALPEGTDLVVTSPGWRPDAVPLVQAARAGVEVIGDVELAWRLRPAGQTWLAVTGTNGKTTTVRMLEAMLRADGRSARAVGNVGTPVVEAVSPGPGEAAADVLAVELSSFQLHWSNSLRPHAATVLNVAPDHLDWHGGLDAYAAAKGRVYAPGTVRVVNAADPLSGRLADRADEADAAAGAAAARRVAFTLDTPRPGELGVVEDLLVDRAFVADPASTAEELATLADVRPAAPHNVANALAAAALARSVGVAPASVRAGLAAFAPEPHRISPVATVAGVHYVDDSKATNPHAAAASLSAYPSIVWVAGGLLKGADVEDLVAAAAPRLRGAVLLGADRDRLRAALDRHAPALPVVEVARSDSGAMAETVAAAAELARPGDTVLLAPAAASMDMFTDYNARGDAFAAAVRALRG
ncbi:UDP-N-acetylmuramoyl-L-alanine--D-glutamate ligase [Marinitenerispora sediminis]|uniref:UDP-N-acetylmuramoylalanine--D-glutamate ligase n=1 Tax=Marinitenerispora sediminis TaxID=1931232 RepID=A0A368T5F4_9ACTN|nr:UDP-N-acetylmuramoyl-L-alanine--D-glutamate ligase [Marinitenerispora sediminis]RCV58931.1 UDP-N-acetylmuramoyl-L-alanine--D-glutamate ligase [Marinitenerispora sediminis]RCV61388.1 UDP-N-acetylmuramoyl-L-alanine--D-glutamate ligase [Marinitenerispora sediminis]